MAKKSNTYTRSPTDPRVRCSLCHKVIIPDEFTAHRKASQIRQKRRRPNDENMKAYQCPRGFWHVGHSKKNSKTREDGGWNDIPSSRAVGNWGLVGYNPKIDNRNEDELMGRYDTDY